MIAGRGKGHLGRIAALEKRLTRPGNMGPPGEPGIAVTFNTVVIDQLYPLTGLDASPTHYIREDAYYELYFQFSQPHYQATGFGFGSGWSGNASGGGWITTNRYGNETINGWSAADDADWHFRTHGPIKRYLFSGDYVQFYTHGGATGINVQTYDALAYIKRLPS